MNFKMPDITLAQVVAGLTFLVGQVVAWGWVDNDTGQWVLSLAVTGISAAWNIADSVIRHGRASVAAAAVAHSGPNMIKKNRVG